MGIEIWTLRDTCWPAALETLSREGDAARSHRMAVVGSRRATPYGRRVAAGLGAASLCGGSRWCRGERAGSIPPLTWAGVACAQTARCFGVGLAVDVLRGSNQCRQVRTAQMGRAAIWPAVLWRMVSPA